jgi:formate hydrogenlyase transcriptional activator
VQRIGAPQPRRVDVRVIAATNRNLQEAIRAGRFRDDLYYRLSVFPVALPPLRARRGDIPLLVWYFVQMRQRALGRQIERIPVSVMAALSAYDWPGNVRELQNVIERALIQTSGPVLGIDAGLLHGEPLASAASAPSDRLEDAARNQILSVLVRCDWRLEGESGAAARLGLAPSSLRHKMARLGIRRPAPAAP